MVAFIDSVSPVWGWVALILWVYYQLYWPVWTTKIQEFHEGLSGRLQRIEITQVALAEEVTGVDSDQVREIHGQEKLSVTDLKDEASTRWHDERKRPED